MKTRISPFFSVLIFSLIVIGIAPIHANPQLDLTVKTDKTKYYAKDTVQVYGNLSLDGLLVTNGLVGIQIQNSQDKLVTIRTLTTGSSPPEAPYVLLSYVVPCDSDGNPKFSFQRGELGWFGIWVGNADPNEDREALITINAYYSDNTPFGLAHLGITIERGTSQTWVLSMPIPVDAILGTSKVYANAYTDWPKLAGTPYCKEVNNTFQITNSGGGAAGQAIPEFGTLQTNETNNFNLTLGLPRKTPYGNCTVYVTSRYSGIELFNSTKFEVYILGDLGSGVPPQFFKFDGKCDGKDYALFLQCFKGLAPPEAMYLGDLGGGVPPQFFKFDGVVDGKDYALFLQCFKGLGP